jgi:hypothetical protein
LNQNLGTTSQFFHHELLLIERKRANDKKENLTIEEIKNSLFGVTSTSWSVFSGVFFGIRMI